VRESRDRCRAEAPQEQERRQLRTEQKVTMIFNNADILDVLTFIDAQTELEIRVAPEVTKRTPISLRVRDEDVAEVFKTAIAQTDLDYEVLDDKTVRVFPKR
jgi:hypothetical protein